MSSAQETMLKPSDVSAASRKYHERRTKATTPTFGLAKVKAAIARIKPQASADEGFGLLASPAWGTMTTPERFTYTMIHGENESQNCDVMPWVVDEERKVFAYPPPVFGGESTWSDRQRKFLTGQRTAVVRLLRSTIRAKGEVGVNLKAAIIELRAHELIPDLLWAYNRGPKDQDILSVLNVLMLRGKYEPFMKSATYRKLYSDQANYQASIEANPANQKLIAERATAFYRSRSR